MGFGHGFAKTPQFRAHALEHLALSSVCLYHTFNVANHEF